MPSSSQFFLRGTSIALALVLPMSVSAGPPPLALMQPEVREDPRIELSVVDPYAEAHLVPLIRSHTNAIIAESGLDKRDAATPWAVRIQVDGYSGNMTIKMAAFRDGQRLGEPIELPCECIGEEILDVIGPTFRSLLSEIQRTEATLAGSANAPPEERPHKPILLEPEHSAQDEIPPPSRGGVGVLGGIGIGVMAVGATGFAYGLARAIQDTEITRGELRVWTTQYQTPSTNAILGLGIVALAAGAVMLGVDVGVCGKRPRGCRRPRSNVSKHFTAPFTVHF